MKKFMKELAPLMTIDEHDSQHFLRRGRSSLCKVCEYPTKL